MLYYSDIIWNNDGYKISSSNLCPSTCKLPLHCITASFGWDLCVILGCNGGYWEWVSATADRAGACRGIGPAGQGITRTENDQSEQWGFVASDHGQAELHAAVTQPAVPVPETEPAKDVEMAVETPLTEGEQSNPLRARHFHMPDRFSGEGTHDVHLFPRQLRRYWTSVKFAQSIWGTTAVQFVSGKALKMWDANLTEFEVLMTLPTFEDFENVWHAAFGSKLTAHEVRVKWENLKKTSSLSDLVREERRLLFEMANTPFAPEFDVCSHFLKVIKKDVSHFLAQNAPVVLAKVQTFVWKGDSIWM